MGRNEWCSRLDERNNFILRIRNNNIQPRIESSSIEGGALVYQVQGERKYKIAKILRLKLIAL